MANDSRKDEAFNTAIQIAPSIHARFAAIGGVPIGADDAGRMMEPRKFLRFGAEPCRIEILNFLDGCEYEVASLRADHEKLGDSHVSILGLSDYVATKRASGRPKDESDLVLLRSMIGNLPGD
jgi:hypothetical protein